MAKYNRSFFPCTLTITSLMSGVMAILVLQHDNFLLAAMLIGVGSILDTLDGQLAVRVRATSEIGKELDSLADMVTFGVAPTILIYNLLLKVGVITPIAVLTSLVFVVAGAYRLARYNTLPSDRSAFFKGMPIPAASILIITGSFWQHWVAQLWWTAVIVLISYLMVSTFPYPKIRHLSALPPMIITAAAMALFVCWVIVGWEAIPFGLFLMYAMSGPLFQLYSYASSSFKFNQP
jgi:CDP-diacylglycerol---serine O-phosphatidyltransferase